MIECMSKPFNTVKSRLMNNSKGQVEEAKLAPAKISINPNFLPS